MSGLKILHVLPRLIGPVHKWSGQANSDGRSWLIDHALDMNFNAIWFSPFFKTSKIPVERDGKTVTGSLYAMRDHFHLDDDFASGGDDDAHIRHFTAEAAKEGLMVMGDMVFNHVARDHPLVLEESKRVAGILATGKNISAIVENNSIVGMKYDTGQKAGETFYFKFDREADFSLTLAGTDEEKWDDVAQINYNSPEANAFFVTGKAGQKGYWKQVLDWHIDRGFTGFRCDVAYKIPPKVWSELIQYAHGRQPGVYFMAETLGDNGQANKLKDAVITVNGQQQKAFDLVMLGTYWWNMKDDWLIHENKRLQAISRFGGAAFPDNHDTANTIAAHFLAEFAAVADPSKRNNIVSDICLRNYGVAALISNSVYMQLGYEYCRKKVSVFHDPATPAYWDKLQAERGNPNHPLNLTQRIRAINDFRDQLDSRAVIDLKKVETQSNNLIRMDCVLRHHETGQKLGKLVVYVNDKPENGPVKVSDTDLQDDNQQRLNRLVLGPGDAQDDHFNTINDIAAFYTPLTNDNRQARPDIGGPSPAFNAA